MSDSTLIKPTDQDIDRWVRVFVPNTMLWWWDDSQIPTTDKAKRIVPRAELGDEPLFDDIAYVNAFHLWAVPKEVSRVLVDDGSWIASLSESDRLRASELQVQFRRGLCIPLERFRDVPLPECATATGHVVLDPALWSSLPEGSKRLVIETELPEWDSKLSYQIPSKTPIHIANIANSFVQQEGINCLSVTAFAITGDQRDLHQWMFSEAFSEVLQRHGYTDYEPANPEPDDVIMFRDDERNIVHAAYVLASDRILNKNGQTSFNPIAITDLVTLKNDWREYSLHVHRRG